MTACNRTWTPLSTANLRTTSLYDRPSKVRVSDFGKPWQAGEGLGRFVDSLPDLLSGRDFKEAVGALCRAVENGRTVMLGMGAHPIKVGLNPLIIDAMEAGYLSALALNGAGVIHDVELALAGKTSEEVADGLQDGQFGTAAETAEFIHRAVAEGHGAGDQGLGMAVARRLSEEKAPYAHLSLLAAAYRCRLPVTVHVAFGTDIIHMHPAMDGAAMGALTHYDFGLFCRVVSTLADGVYINLGSAVILPEVFLKAVSVAANLGHSLSGLTTVAMDFQRQYRSLVNVVERPTAGRGRGIYLVGHHEIMFPLLMACVREQLQRERG